MTTTRRDPLLMAAHIVLALLIALLIFALAMIGIGFGAILTVGRGELLAKLAEAGAPPSAFWAVAVLLPLIAGMIYAALRFALELRGIVRSVDQGDPFQPENADRLSRMGWLTVGIYVQAIIAGLIAAWIASVAKGLDDTMRFDLDLGGGGILLILVLFILARVFRHGSAMREDLEGTV